MKFINNINWGNLLIIILIVIIIILIILILYKNLNNCKSKSTKIYRYIPKNVQVFQFNNKFSNKYISNNPDKPLSEIIIGNKFKLNNNFNESNLILFSDYSLIDQNIKNIPFKYDFEYFIFGINGSDDLASKSQLGKYMREGGYSNYIPKTYIINNNNDMNELKSKHIESNIYMLKKNIQRQEGNLITKDINFILTRAKSENYVVCQELLQNPYLVNKRKINLRIYLLILSYDDIINFYIYNNGFMYYTPKYFEKGSIEKDVNITTGYIDRKVYEENPLTIQDLYEFLGNEKSKILKNNIINLFRAVKIVYSKILLKKNDDIPGLKFNIFGTDVAPDENLLVTLIEINKGPDLSYKDERDKNIKLTMMHDCFTIAGLSKLGNKNNFIKI